MAVNEKTRSLAKLVFGGVGVIAAAGVVNRLFSLITAPVLTKVLGPSPYGVVALLSTITSLATTISMLGIDHGYARFFFSGTPEERDAVEQYCWRFAIAMTSAVSAASVIGWWAWSGLAGMPAELAVMVFAGIVLSVITAMSTTMRRLRGDYLRIAVSTVAAGGTGAALTIALALFWRNDAWALLAGGAGGLALGVVITGIPSSRPLVQRSRLPAASRREIFRLGIAGAAISPLYWLMSSADRWLIGIWNGKDALGIYAFAVTLGMTGILLNSAITLTWFPEMTKVYEASREAAKGELGRMWSRLVGGLLVTWLAIAAAGGDLLRILADSRFHAGSLYIPWVAGGVFFYGVASLANTGLLLRKDLSPVVGWWALGAGVNVVLNVLLVRTFGGWGAAVASCLSYALIAGGVMRSAQLRYRLVVPWRRLGAAGALALAAGIPMSVPWSGAAGWSLVLKFPVGLASAAALAWIVAPDWMNRLPCVAAIRGQL